MVSKEFLAMIRCPENRSALALADAALVGRLNDAIDAGWLRNRAGQAVAEFLDGGLVREDQAIVYPIVRQIPILLVDEGIPLEQVTSGTSKLL
ncbi:MAG TPA: hypothetical protein VGY55_10480 [Pirellulales bacterium]|nr:hypothetical protein [Pirellulales bacterium]